MPGDSRLKPSTQRAFGSRKKRAWNKKAPATSAPSAAELESRPDPLDLPGTSTDDTVGPSSTSETLRVDAAYYSTAEQAQRVERSAQTKTVLSGKSATQRKFDLLGVSAECQTGDAGTDFLLVDMKVLNNFFAQAKCDKCDAKSLSVRKATDKEYGLAVKLIFSCSSCDFEKKQFSSPRVSGTATITPFEVNMRAMKGIQMIGKGVTALSDFCACMNLSHRGLHHKTFQGHLKSLVKACENTATESEAASVAVIKELYTDFLNPIGNIDVVFDGSWMTRGRSSHIGVGCIIELYTGLVIDHVVYSNFCLGCALGPQPRKRLSAFTQGKCNSSEEHQHKKDSCKETQNGCN